MGAQLEFLARLQPPPSASARVSTVTLLLYAVSFYLVLSRLGPIVGKVGEKAADSLEGESSGAERDLQSFREVCRRFGELTRVPGLFARRSPNNHSVSLLSLIMGNSSSRKLRVSRKEKGAGGEEAARQPPQQVEEKEDKGAEQLQDKPDEAGDTKTEVAAPPGERDEGSPVEEEESDPEDPSTESKRASREETDGPFSRRKPGKTKAVRFAVYENKIATGDLALLYRDNSEIPHYAVFVQCNSCDPNFPLLLIKGKTKPLLMEKFDHKGRHAHPVSAVSRIFYGDYSKVAVRHLRLQEAICATTTMELIDKVQGIPFSDKELEAIETAQTAAERSSIVCTFMVAHLYKLMGILDGDPGDVLPTTLQDNLQLSDPVYIKLPAMKPGPLLTGDPPFLEKLVDGIRAPRDIITKPYSDVVKTLDTGDLVLFSGATSSGALIKFFDNSEFSHIGLVLKAKYTSQMLIYEASTNRAGLVDIESGKVRQGVELLPLRYKVFSGWYDRVAVRRLTGITQEQRSMIYDGLLELRKEFQGRPYEKSKLELLLSTLNIQEGFLSFLHNQQEDLSSLFCSELVAATYQRLGLIGRERLSNEFTPDDFTSASNLQLNFGRLEPEEYINLKFDFGCSYQAQDSVY